VPARVDPSEPGLQGIAEPLIGTALVGAIPASQGLGARPLPAVDPGRCGVWAMAAFLDSYRRLVSGIAGLAIGFPFEHEAAAIPPGFAQ